jgi:hypothetical protein
MTYRPELPQTELPRGSRTLVRPREGNTSTLLFPGWGPKL